jgi:hypothetical protein
VAVSLASILQLCKSQRARLDQPQRDQIQNQIQESRNDNRKEIADQ